VGEIVGDASLASASTFGLELIDEIDGGEEAPARSGADATPRDGDGQMRLACAGSADQDDVALLGDEAARSRTRASLIGVSLKAKSSTSLASGSLATVS
jgi:hypothetical protein